MKYILFLALGLSLTLGSCKKFLEETPTGTLTTDATITSAAGGLALATGPYRSLQDWTGGGDQWGKSLPASLEYATGKAYSQYMGSILWVYESNSIAGDYDYFINQWNNWFRGVRDCNNSIAMLPKVTGLTADQKSAYLGEVRTLRAFYYFNLVRYFGDVPLNTTVITDISQASRPRTSLKTIYDKVIVPDLEFAVNESSMADVQSSTGRVTKLTARTLLADVYLTMAGYPYQEVNTSADTTKRWCVDGLWTMTDYPVNTSSAKELLQKSKTQLDFLYGKFALGKYSDMRTSSMNNKGEAIFQAQYLANTRENGVVQVCLPLASQISYNDENGTFVPSLAYHDSYNPADLRVQERQYFFTSDTKSKKYDVNESPAAKFPMPFLFKYYDVDKIKNNIQSSLNWTFYRYSDVLLMLTEVNWTLNQLGVSVSEADITKGINAIRTRALLPTYAGTDVTLKNIMAERAYELIFENKMLWDMRRTRKALKDGSGEFKALENLVGHQPTNFNYQFSPKHLLSPVSGTEIDNNKQCLQNFGWAPKQVGQ
jgi:hypothetical protein